MLKASHPTEFILIRKNGRIEKSSGIGEYAFDDLQNGDLLYVLQHRNLKNIITVSIEKTARNLAVYDEQLYCLFKKYKDAKKVRLPYELRMRLYGVKNQTILARDYLDNVEKSNSISAIMIKMLEEILDEQK